LNAGNKMNKGIAERITKREQSILCHCKTNKIETPKKTPKWNYIKNDKTSRYEVITDLDIKSK
jgi:hypothetical protein